MPRYRIFTNDRGSVGGVPLYSCFRDISADNDFHARKKAYAVVPVEFRSSPLAEAYVLEWPATSPAAKKWLAEHVDVQDA